MSSAANKSYISLMTDYFASLHFTSTAVINNKPHINYFPLHVINAAIMVKEYCLVRFYYLPVFRNTTSVIVYSTHTDTAGLLLQVPPEMTKKAEEILYNHNHIHERIFIKSFSHGFVLALQHIIEILEC